VHDDTLELVDRVILFNVGPEHNVVAALVAKLRTVGVNI